MIALTRVRPSSLAPLSRLLPGCVLGCLPGCLLGCLLSCLLLVPVASVAAVSPSELLDAGRADDAIRLLTPSAAAGNAQASNFLCRVYYALGDWDNALQNCERAAQLQPGNAAFQLWLGRSYGQKANHGGHLAAYSLARKCVAAFIAARTLDHHSLAIARDLAEYYATAPAIVGGGGDKALQLAAELAPEHPSDAAWVRAKVAAGEGQAQQAENEYNNSILLDHNSACTYIDFARYLEGRKSWDQFQQSVESAVRSPRLRPIDRYDAAELLLATNRDLPQAARQMRAYIQGHTEEAAPLFRAHFLLGEILLKSGDAAQAAAEYKAALALASSYRPASDALRRLEQR
jgi:tetratricopeptide (TPR) repeat protein